MLQHSTATIEPAPLDRVLQALADPTRRRMVEVLSEGPVSVSELAKPFDMTLSAIVQHLAVLESSGVVRSEKVGRVRTCRLDPAALDTAEQWVHQRRAEWERRFDRLDQFLARTAPAAAEQDASKSPKKEPSP